MFSRPFMRLQLYKSEKNIHMLINATTMSREFIKHGINHPQIITYG